MSEQLAREIRPSELSDNCICCGSSMTARLVPWLKHCGQCDFWSSTLWDEERWSKKLSALDESARKKAIENLRRENARTILARVSEFRKLVGADLVDVGCGYGWFLDEAKRMGLRVVGIEPEQRIAAEAKRLTGCQVLEGCFPEILPQGSAFDFISFNDVFEHLKDPKQALEACYEFLKPGGILILNLPMSSGVFFKLATFLKGIGIENPLDRMWQRNFHSPHLSYFNQQNLSQLVTRHGFKLLNSSPLKSITLEGMSERVAMDGTTSPLISKLFGLALTLLYFPLSKMPADITLQLYRKEN